MVDLDILQSALLCLLYLYVDNSNPKYKSVDLGRLSIAFSDAIWCVSVKRLKTCFFWRSGIPSTCSASRALVKRAQEAGDGTGADAGDITGVGISIKGSSMKDKKN